MLRQLTPKIGISANLDRLRFRHWNVGRGLAIHRIRHTEDLDRLRILRQIGSDIRRDLNGTRLVELHLFTLYTTLALTVHHEVHQVAATVRNVGRAALLDHLQRLVIVDSTGAGLDVGPAATDQLAVDARPVRLAANKGPEPAVKRVIPDIELGDEVGVADADPVHRVMSHCHDELVGSDAIHWRRDVVRQLRRLHVETKSRMRVAAHATLGLNPLSGRGACSSANPSCAWSQDSRSP